MPITKEKERSYFKKILSYYFAPVWESFFKILYLIFFFWFLVFNSGKLLIAFNFFLDTLFQSPSVLTIEYLFWGVVFIISLIIPFSISLYAIILFYEIWTGAWQKSYKFLSTTAIILAIPLVIILMDDVTRTAGNQEPLIPFVEEHNLNILL